jgi:hypothetical protein
MASFREVCMVWDGDPLYVDSPRAVALNIQYWCRFGSVQLRSVRSAIFRATITECTAMLSRISGRSGLPRGIEISRRNTRAE